MYEEAYTMMNSDDVRTCIQNLRIPGGELTPETVQEICGMIERGEMTLQEVCDIVGSVGHISVLDRRITPDVFHDILGMVQRIREIRKSELHPEEA
jgi:hypothetical protein